MQVIKTFLAGAFLGAGAVGGLTHAAWSSAFRMSTVIPALTVADLVEVGGGVVAGLVAMYVVARQEHQGVRTKPR